MTYPKIAEVFAPGEYIREELETRRWTQGDLAAILQRPLGAVNEIANAKKCITAETAKELAAAFSTSAELWVNLESAYRLAKAKDPDPGITQRAKRRLATVAGFSEQTSSTARWSLPKVRAGSTKMPLERLRGIRK